MKKTIVLFLVMMCVTIAQATISLDFVAGGAVNPVGANPYAGFGGQWLGSSMADGSAGMSAYTPLANSPDTLTWPNGTYSSWQVELVLDTGAANDYSTMLSEFALGQWDNQGDSILLNDAGSQVIEQFSGDLAGTPGFTISGGIGSGIISNSYAGNSFYVRFYNADTLANATEAGFIYNTNLWVLPSADSSISANLFSDVGTEGTLQNGTVGNFNDLSDGMWSTVAAVPEPGTMLLFGLGLGVMALRRKRR